jgi:hypothetical protein
VTPELDAGLAPGVYFLGRHGDPSCRARFTKTD